MTLSFWYEGGGIGNAPDLGEDSLIVEFKSIGSEGDSVDEGLAGFARCYVDN